MTCTCMPYFLMVMDINYIVEIHVTLLQFLENLTTIKSVYSTYLYPMKYIGKTTDTLRRLKFELPQNLPF